MTEPGSRVNAAAATAFAALQHARSGRFLLALEHVAAALAVFPDAPHVSMDGCGSTMTDAVDDLAAALTVLGAHSDAAALVERHLMTIDVDVDRCTSFSRLIIIHLSWALALDAKGEPRASSDRLERATRLSIGSVHGTEGCTVMAGCGPLICAARALRNPSEVDAVTVAALVSATRCRLQHDDIRGLLALAAARSKLETWHRSSAAHILATALADLDPISMDPAVRLALLRERASAIDPRTCGSEGRLDDAIVEQARMLKELQEAALALARDRHRLGDEATLDPVTGLANRRAADSRLRELSHRAEPTSIVLIDVDGFKSVNDTLSHAAGDAVLREIAAQLGARLRRADTLARYGGDEFLVVMPNTNTADAAAALERSAIAIAALPTTTSGGVTLSVGIAYSGSDPQAGVARADAAMYRAKRAGGNRIVVDPGELL